MADPKNIDEALLAFQADRPTLVKDKKAHNSTYADLAQVYDAALPKLNALGVLWKAKATVPDGGEFGLDYALTHVASSTSETGFWPLKRVDNPQQMGSLVTYARRYALCAALNLVAEEDDDGAAASGQRHAQRAAQQGRARQQPAEPEGRPVQRAHRASQPPLPGENPGGKVEPRQMRQMHALWNELGYGGDENRSTRLARTANILGLPDLNSSSDLTQAQASQVIEALQNRQRQLAAAKGGAE
jgi:hypothetical protein